MPWSIRVKRSRGLQFVDLKLFIQFVHPPDVDKNECNKQVDGALLCKPEPELEAGNPEPIQIFSENNSETKGNNQPDTEQYDQIPQVLFPIHMMIFSHDSGFTLEIQGAEASQNRYLIFVQLRWLVCNPDQGKKPPREPV